MACKSEECDNPFEVCTDSTLGRYLVANRPIRAGEIILQENPLVQGPFQHTVPVCLSCGKTLNPFNNKPCTKCGWPLCRNEDCENSERHVPECTFTVKKGNKINIKHFGMVHPNYRSIMILRCLYHKEHNPDVWERLMQLESHYESLDNQERQTAEFVRNFFSLQVIFTLDEVLRIAGVLKTNGQEVPLTDPPYMAVFDTCSMFEHNCRANCSKTFTNSGDVLITASEDIKKGDNLSICYTHPLWGTLSRRAHLHQTKNFWCHCARCSDPTEFGTNISALKCPKRKCEGLLLPKSFVDEADQPWTCSQCKRELTFDYIKTVLDEIGQQLVDLPKGAIPSILMFIEDYSDILPPNHFYMLDVKVALMQLLGCQVITQLSTPDLTALVETAENLSRIIKEVAPAERRLLGIIMFQLAVGWVELSRRLEDDGKSLMKQIEKSQDALVECCLLLENEPSNLPESQIYRKAKLELRESSRLLTQANSEKLKCGG